MPNADSQRNLLFNNSADSKDPKVVMQNGATAQVTVENEIQEETPKTNIIDMISHRDNQIDQEQMEFSSHWDEKVGYPVTP